ncbi:MAG: hypothetical protein K1Y01_00590 [Vicinamibacteria bacterium]|nr:hypothetical protein [Vicinamibacteria bacterium]
MAAIRAGLKSPDAPVRAAAGRVASVSDPSGFVGELSAALAAEGNGEAAREEAWALAIGDPVGFLGPIIKAAEREGIRDEVLEALGAAKGARMPEIWAALPKSLVAEGAPALVRGARRTGNLALIAPLILRDQLVEGWREVLSGASLEPVASGLLVAALGSPSSRIRTEAYVALLGDGAVQNVGVEPKPAADRQERIARRLFDAARGVSSEIQLDREISQSTDEDSGLAAQLRVRLPKGSQVTARVHAGLTQSETSALLRWIEGWSGGYVEKSETVLLTVESVNPARKSWGRTTTTIGTIKGLPTGFADAVLREWGCGSEDRSIVASAVFEDDGRPSQVKMARKAGEKGCGAAAQVLFGAALGSLPKGRAALVLPAYRQWLECFAATQADEWEPGPLPEMRSAAFAGDLVEPRKTKNVPPGYAGGHQGVQLWGEFGIRAVLGRAGCVLAIEGFRVSQGAQDLDFIDAVSRWAYTPMMFRGAPTAVRFGVKASFVLN